MISTINSSPQMPLDYSANGSMAPSSTTTSTLSSNSTVPSQLGLASTPTPDASLNSTFATITTMLQNLMTMIQSLLKGLSSPGIGNSTQPGVGTPGYNGITREPPTIIPVTPRDTQPKTVTVNNDAKPSTVDQAQGASSTGSTKKTRKTKKTSSTKKSSSKKRATLKGGGEFLWKPQSDKDGKLAILVPKNYSGKIASVQILSPDDDSKVLAKGKASGIGNGDREHFRFNKAGGEFPDGSVVLITLKDGSELQVPIKDTAARYTK
jgi:hypothetical protein